MATRTSFLAPSNTNDATFRLWINEIHNSLIAFGWTQTADSGQINFSTVTAPTAISTMQGYAMYAMGDSLQSTYPVYLRIDFGSTSQGADCPGIKVNCSIGSSTDGAGVLLGAIGTQETFGSNNSGSSTTRLNCRTSGNSSSFRMHFWASENVIFTIGWYLDVSRECDSNGDPSSGGVCFLTCAVSTSGGNRHTSQFLSGDGGIGAQETTWFAWVSAQQSQAGQGYCGASAVRCAYGAMRNPMKSTLLLSSDFPALSLINAKTYGTYHPYLVVHPCVNQPSPNLNGWNTTARIGMLWE